MNRLAHLAAEGFTALLIITMPFWVHHIAWWIAGGKPWDAIV